MKIKAAKPAQRACKLAGTDDLFLLVQPMGSKLWRCKFRLQGIEEMQSPGAFAEVGLAAASAAHAASRSLVANGINSAQARRAERQFLAIAGLRQTQGSVGAGHGLGAATGAALRPSTVGQRHR